MKKAIIQKSVNYAASLRSLSQGEYLQLGRDKEIYLRQLAGKLNKEGYRIKVSRCTEGITVSCLQRPSGTLALGEGGEGPSVAA